MPRMGRLALAALWAYAAEAQSPTQAPTLRRGGRRWPARRRPRRRPRRRCDRRRRADDGQADQHGRPPSPRGTAAADAIDCLLQACRDCLGPSTADGGMDGARCTNSRAEL